jgi:hypothetical protein
MKKVYENQNNINQQMAQSNQTITMPLACCAIQFSNELELRNTLMAAAAAEVEADTCDEELSKT